MDKENLRVLYTFDILDCGYGFMGAYICQN